MAGPSVANNSETWFNLPLNHEDQAHFLAKFRQYSTETSGYSGDNLLNVIREDFTLAEFSEPTIILNYEIYKRIKKYLEENGVQVVTAVSGHTNVFERIVFTIWPEEEFAEDRRQAYLRMLDVRAAHQGRGP